MILLFEVLMNHDKITKISFDFSGLNLSKINFGKELLSTFLNSFPKLSELSLDLSGYFLSRKKIFIKIN